MTKRGIFINSQTRPLHARNRTTRTAIFHRLKKNENAILVNFDDKEIVLIVTQRVKQRKRGVNLLL